MKSEVDVPAKVDLAIDIDRIVLSLTSKTARISTAPGLDGGTFHDFTAQFDALSAPDQLVITDFFKDMIANYLGVPLIDVTGDVFLPDI